MGKAEALTENGSKVFECPPDCEQCKHEARERRVAEDKRRTSAFDWRKK